MTSKRSLLISLLFFTLSPLFSQIIIKGTVYDKKSRETLIGANVIIPKKGLGTMTDIDGFFQIESERLPVEIEISFI